MHVFYDTIYNLFFQIRWINKQHCKQASHILYFLEFIIHVFNLLDVIITQFLLTLWITMCCMCLHINVHSWCFTFFCRNVVLFVTHVAFWSNKSSGIFPLVCWCVCILMHILDGSHVCYVIMLFIWSKIQSCISPWLACWWFFWHMFNKCLVFVWIHHVWIDICVWCHPQPKVMKTGVFS